MIRQFYLKLRLKVLEYFALRAAIKRIKANTKNKKFLYD